MTLQSAPPQAVAFEFQEGQTVMLKGDNPALCLRRGDIGTIWAQYATSPPAYEVLFCAGAQDERSALLSQEDLQAQERNAGTPSAA